MKNRTEQMTIIIQKGRQRIVTKTPLEAVDKFVLVINRQFTNAPNTTQLASGAGHSSAAGSNAAIRSPLTQQQQSVGAGGIALNKGALRRRRPAAAGSSAIRSPRTGKHIVMIVNDQTVKLRPKLQNASATQVASGGGAFSTGGTNSAIQSPGTRQQHAVGGDGTALNKWTRSRSMKRKSRKAARK